MSLFKQCFTNLRDLKDEKNSTKLPPLWLVHDALSKTGVPSAFIPAIQLLLGVEIINNVNIGKTLRTHGAQGKLFPADMIHQCGIERVIVKKHECNECCIREATFMSRFPSTRGIVNYYGLTQFGYDYYIVMRMASGSIHDFIGGAFINQSIMSLLSDVFTGLAKLHQHGIVHCDISCSNILVSYSTSIIASIADFGASVYTWAPAAAASQKLQKMLLPAEYESFGTPGYIAPDVRRTTSSDMWSVGCVIAKIFLGLEMTGDVSELDQKIKNLNHYAFGKLVGKDGRRILILLHGLLKLDYKQRLTALEALKIIQA